MDYRSHEKNDTDPSSSSISAPSINLPKGGGAIRGIGEKFSANPVNGTGGMSIPIATSPGRSGFGVQLSLQYNSGTGNGPFGFGWDLSMPAITRKTEKGLPQYLDEQDSDVFILAGAEDLVPSLVETSSGWVAEPASPRSLDGQMYTIRRYRPRIESMFARIEGWTNQRDPSDCFWRITSRDNVSSWYGKTHESRIADPQNPEHIFSWLICHTTDDRGNAIVYEYTPEDSENIPPGMTHERNRSATSRSANRYLKRIKYGNRTTNLDPASGLPRDPPGYADWMFEVVLDYGEGHTSALDSDHILAQIDPPGSWPARADAFSTYRPGFEVRTYRLCRRALMFHHFPTELGIADCLVRSTDFTYVESPLATQLTSVTQCGYLRQPDGSHANRYLKKNLPPLEFEYSRTPGAHELASMPPQEVPAGDLENLPVGADGRIYHWIDLHGEGIPGILSQQGGAWFYKRNISPISAHPVGFAPLERVAVWPNLAPDSGARFMDFAGNGQLQLVQLDGPLPGFYQHDRQEGWEDFRPFSARLNRDFNDPNLRLIDLDGDGYADLLITEGEVLTWHASLQEAGFGPAQPAILATGAWDEQKGPRLIFADASESIYLADFSGDGLTDIARIRNGEVCYWPNLGYGRFGAQVSMDASPWFDEPDQFEQARIRLADINGTGSVDLIYLHRDGARLYFNQCGSAWGAAQQLGLAFQPDDLASVAAIDLFGNGTASLVWGSTLPGDSRHAVRFLDLMAGQKPYLLVKSVNNKGAETRIQYAASTRFYLQDKYAGKPWVTRLPFPVHVVEQVQTIDHISRHRFVARYAYHHGYYDGVEREFRGFGMIEQWDTEAYEDYVVGTQAVGGDQDLAPELYQPPVLTRSWYHTGSFIDQQQIINQYRHEYYRQEQHLGQPALPPGMDTPEYIECLRSLKGLPLRQEIYSFDGSAQEQYPYQVTENNVDVRMHQPRGGQRYAVFLPVPRESISLAYERSPLDPRISHDLNLEIDPLGNILKSCSVVYGRKLVDASLPRKVTDAQQKSYITYGETTFTADIDQQHPGHAYRLGVPYETRSYEITGIAPASSLFQLDEIRRKIAAALSIDYEVAADGATAQKRLLAHGRSLFQDANLSPLPLGQSDSLGLVYQGYQLAFTPGVTGAHYAGKVTDADFLAAGYQHFDSDANWWIPSGTAIYPANPRQHFYLPLGARDAFGVETLADLDRYDLLVEKVRTIQAAWNETSAVNDYRVLGPVMMTDPNKNHSAVEIDALGMVVKSAVMGKDNSPDGDSLADPTTRMEYELFNWMNNRQPNFAHSFRREQHGPSNPRWQESLVYSNGSGAVAMVKAQAHPGKALALNPDGTTREVDAEPRWVGSGRVIINNKGNPVKQYEPYFSATHEYEDEKSLREIGKTAIQYYDAMGRKTRTLYPDGTLTRLELNAWMQKAFDANDTVTESRWYAERGSPDPTTEAEPQDDPQRRAAWLAAKHAATPPAAHFDSLGRPIYTVADYGAGTTAAVRVESDLTQRTSNIYDQKERLAASTFTGMAGGALVSESAEKGRQWTFQNILGAPVKIWDEHDREYSFVYDALQRPLATSASAPGQPAILLNYTVYGDRHPQAVSLNLLGHTHLVFDQGGMLEIPAADFKGNPKRVERTLANKYNEALDWQPVSGQTTLDAIRSSAAALLETGEVFTGSAEYDALNRPTRSRLPDGTIILPTYNESNFLSSLKAQVRGRGAWIEFLKGQDYDAKGQRQFAQYGNDAYTRYFYDPNTFRLAHLLTCKGGANPGSQALQDLKYAYDPVGNIVQVDDDAQQTRFFNNQVVRPQMLYRYDAIYQLVQASGREHAGQGNNQVPASADLEVIQQLPHNNEIHAVRNYSEYYTYDLLGNMLTKRHAAGLGADLWTQRLRYLYQDDPGNRTNRLGSSSRPGDPDDGPYTASYDYDHYGNMTRLLSSTPHELTWNLIDQLQRVDLDGGGAAYYVYDQDGQRLRKVIERNGSTLLEWIYLGPVRIFRRRWRSTRELRLERWTVHIGDDSGMIAQVDTKTIDGDQLDHDNPLDAALIRYQYANHLGSAVLETDAHGTPISYEEYHPSGTCAYHSSRPGFDLSLKRFRFSGKECDDESGLYYFGARYYAPWLSRWTSPDPMGFVDGLNIYVFTVNNPVTFTDSVGFKSKRTGRDKSLSDRTNENEDELFMAIPQQSFGDSLHEIGKQKKRTAYTKHKAQMDQMLHLRKITRNYETTVYRRGYEWLAVRYRVPEGSIKKHRLSSENLITYVEGIQMADMSPEDIANPETMDRVIRQMQVDRAAMRKAGSGASAPNQLLITEAAKRLVWEEKIKLPYKTNHLTSREYFTYLKTYQEWELNGKGPAPVPPPASFTPDPDADLTEDLPPEEPEVFLSKKLDMKYNVYETITASIRIPFDFMTTFFKEFFGAIWASVSGPTLEPVKPPDESSVTHHRSKVTVTRTPDQPSQSTADESYVQWHTRVYGKPPP